MAIKPPYKYHDQYGNYANCSDYNYEYDYDYD